MKLTGSPRVRRPCTSLVLLTLYLLAKHVLLLKVASKTIFLLECCLLEWNLSLSLPRMLSILSGLEEVSILVKPHLEFSLGLNYSVILANLTPASVPSQILRGGWRLLSLQLVFLLLAENVQTPGLFQLRFSNLINLPSSGIGRFVSSSNHESGRLLAIQDWSFLAQVEHFVSYSFSYVLVRNEVHRSGSNTPTLQW